MLILDLCSGPGEASQAMARRGWQVVRVDIDPAVRPDIVADVRAWSWDGPRPDLVLASPPFDQAVILACRRIITECKPHYWAIVPGARLPAGVAGALAEMVEEELGVF